MPLYKRLPFKPSLVPNEAKPDDEVFYCPLTKEVFLDYEKFYAREIQLNSLVWSCSLTKKSNMTFEEALESERNARESLDSIPEIVETAVCSLMALTGRSRIDDVHADVWTFIKDKFVIGELVDVVQEDGTKAECRVVDAKYSGAASGSVEEVVTVSDSDDEVKVEKTEGDDQKKAPPKKKKKPTIKGFIPKGNCYSYFVERRRKSSTSSPSKTPGDRFWVEHDDISRLRGTLTRPRLRLYLTTCTVLKDGQYFLKSDFHDRCIDFEKLFAGPKPGFVKTPMVKTKPKPKAEATKNKKITQFFKEVPNDKPKPKKKKKEEVAQEKAAKSQVEKVPPRPVTPDPEELKRKRLEEREKLREKQRLEREKMKEQKKLEQQAFLEWKRMRDDLTCDDFAPLPALAPFHVPPAIPNDLFSRLLGMLQFISSFKEQLCLSDFFPDTFTLTTLSDCLWSVDADGSMPELFQMFLCTLFQYQEQEDGDEVDLDDRNECQDAPELDNLLYRPLVVEATLNAEECRGIHGCSVRDLPLDRQTFSEVLRVHIAAGGYFAGRSVYAWRYQHRGGFRSSDDHAIEFKRRRPDLVEKLANEDMFAFSAVERLEILELLQAQILSFATLRDELDNANEKFRLLRWKLRQLQFMEQRQEREADAARYKVENWGEEKLFKFLLNEKKTGDGKTPPATPAPPIGANPAAVTAIDGIPLEIQQKRGSVAKLIAAELERMRYEANRRECRGRGSNQTSKKADKGLANDHTLKYLSNDLSHVKFDYLSLQDIVQVRDLQKEHNLTKERLLLNELGLVIAKAGAGLLGRDRAFQRYWLVPAVSGIVVEGPQLYDTGPECLPEQTPLSKVDPNVISDVRNSLQTGALSPICPIPLLPLNNNKEECKTNGVILADGHGSPPALINGFITPPPSVAKTPTPKRSGGSKSKTTADVMALAANVCRRLFVCSGNTATCAVHNPANRDHLSAWNIIPNVGTLDALCENLNRRGIRENDLYENLRLYRLKLVDFLVDGTSMSYSQPDWVPASVSGATVESHDVDTKVKTVLDESSTALRGLLLDVEEKIHLGGLGSLRVSNRTEWRNLIETGQYNPYHAISIGSLVFKPEDVQAGPAPLQMACALFQIAVGIQTKFLKEPFNSEEETETKNDNDEPAESINCFEAWQRSLLDSKNISRVFLHLASLERHIKWTKSLLNARCRSCRRKGDAVTIRMCTDCERTYHLDCARGGVTVDTAWYCADCKPKHTRKRTKRKDPVLVDAEMYQDERRVSSRTSRRNRGPVDYAENTDEEEEMDNEEEPEEEEEEEQSSFEDEEQSTSTSRLRSGRRKRRIERGHVSENESADEEEVEEEQVEEEEEESGEEEEEGEEGEGEEEEERDNEEEEEEEDTGSGSDEGESPDVCTSCEAEVENKRRAVCCTNCKDWFHCKCAGLSSPPRKWICPDCDNRPVTRKIKLRSPAKTRRSRNSSVERRSSRHSSVERKSSKRREINGRSEGNNEAARLALCSQLLDALRYHPNAWPFLKAVSRKQVEDYYDVIKQPMDWGTMERKLSRGQYATYDDFMTDARLVFHNCRTYNRPDSEIYEIGEELEAFMDEKIGEIGLERPLSGLPQRKRKRILTDDD